jgi:hypothetical protein
MFENITFGFYAILPILLMMTLGYLFRRTSFLKKEFFIGCDKLVFYVALPLLLFEQMMEAEFQTVWDEDLLLFVTVAIVVAFIGILLLGPALIANKVDRGAFCQGSVRSNYSIIGLPMANNLFGAAGYQTAALIMPFLIPLYNALAVLILTVNAPGEKNFLVVTLKVLKGIVINPLILSMALGAAVKYFTLPVPDTAMKIVGYCANLTLPLALMSLGATFEFSRLKGKILTAFSASVIKTILLPAIAVTVGVYMGFRNLSLGMIFIVFAGPTSVSSYSMAVGMGANKELAGQIVVLSTILSMFTMFIGAFLLRSFGLI